MQFNDRVLEEARHPQNPLLERVKFLAITASNLDEFFMIRAASIIRSISSKQKKLEWREARQLQKLNVSVLEAVGRFTSRQVETMESLRTELAEINIHIVRQPKEGEREFEIGYKLFHEHILPKLDPPESFSFAQLNTLENLQAAAIFPGGLWLKIPRSLPSMFYFFEDTAEPKLYFYFLDDLIATHLWTTSNKWVPGFVRLTRDADFTQELGNEDPESVPDVILNRLGNREKGRPIRLQFSGDLTPDFLDQCRINLKLRPLQIVPAAGNMFLHGLWSVVNNTPENFEAKNKSQIRYPALTSKIPQAFGDATNLFERVTERDYLLHHPYDSFDAFVQFIQCAANDPLVESIEQTVYRMDALSPTINILKWAAKSKKVRVVIELRARFDELNNLRLADELEKAGVEVAFGFGALKVHAKVALVSRRENGELRLYTHLSTGNYNAKTARQYTDLAIITANSEIGADARLFFDSIFRGEIPQNFKQLVVAPTKLARRLKSHILQEAEAARAGKPARIVAKVNALVDEGIIESLYEASQAGVQVDLIVRGACSLVPGIKGLSENIRVVSIVDRFLEHSRIYYFASAKKMYLSSADWMPRNFFSRLEIAFPVLDPRIYSYLESIVIPSYLADTAKARELTHLGTWIRRTPKGGATPLRSQVLFREMALHDYKGTPLEY